MSKIKINEIPTVGMELFTDSESFIQELNSEDMIQVAGGIAVTEPYTYNPFPAGPCLPLSPYDKVPDHVNLPYCAVIL